MKPVSSSYMEAVTKKTRRTVVTISFPFVDPDAKGSSQIVTAPEQTNFSRINQLIDDNYDLVGKVAQFEPGYWKLDGSVILPLAAGTNSQYGFWSQALSNTERVYPENTVIRFTFSEPVDLPGLTLWFDNLTNNFPSDFDIVFYDYDFNPLRNVEVRGLTESYYTMDQGAQSVRWVDLHFLKSNIPQRRLRIVEIDFGIMILFQGSNLFTAKLVSQCDPLSETIPNSELNFTARNNGKFDYTNPDSYAKYLQQRQTLSYLHGAIIGEDILNGDVEYADMGTYSLQEWSVEDSKLTMRARLDLSALEDDVFKKYSLSESISAGTLLERIFADCNWTNYFIEPYLYTSPAIVPYTGKVSHKEAIRMVASFAGAVVLINPQRQIQIVRINFDSDPVANITYANMFKPTNASTAKYYNAINISKFAVVAKAVEDGKAIVEYTDTVNGTQNFIIPFDYELYDNSPIVSITGATLAASALYANYAFITVSGSGSFNFKVTGRTADFNESKEMVYAPWYQPGEPVYAYDFTVPMLIGGTTWNDIKNWCTTEKFRTLNYRLAANLNWRQNPALDIGDYANIQLDKNNLSSLLFLTEQNLTYSAGTLKGTSKGIGKGIG